MRAKNLRSEVPLGIANCPAWNSSTKQAAYSSSSGDHTPAFNGRGLPGLRTLIQAGLMNSSDTFAMLGLQVAAVVVDGVVVVISAAVSDVAGGGDELILVW